MAVTGRPTKMTEKTIKKLEEGFLIGLSDREASLFADITPATLYAYCEKFPEFSERKELLKEQVKIRAKQNVSNAIESGDKTLSQWFLERRDKDFKPKQEVENSGALTVNVVSYAPPQVPTEGLPATSPSGD